MHIKTSHEYGGFSGQFAVKKMLKKQLQCWTFDEELYYLRKFRPDFTFDPLREGHYTKKVICAVFCRCLLALSFGNV